MILFWPGSKPGDHIRPLFGVSPTSGLDSSLRKGRLGVIVDLSVVHHRTRCLAHF